MSRLVPHSADESNECRAGATPLRGRRAVGGSLWSQKSERSRWKLLMSKLFLFLLLSCAAFLALSSVDSADAAPKGAACVVSVGANPCDAGLSCLPTNVGRTTGICCPRWQGTRPAETHRGRVVRWKCADMAFSW